MGRRYQYVKWKAKWTMTAYYGNLLFLQVNERCHDTAFLVYKNHAYKNIEAQICLKFKNIVAFFLVAISVSFQASDKI